MRRWVHSLLAIFGGAVLASALVASSARADIYVLTDDGQVTGEIVNREDIVHQDDTAKKDYVIRTADGAIVTFTRSQLKQIIPQSDAEAEYEKMRPTFADTVDDQSRLAEWCRQKSLTKQRQAALQRVIELDPDNKAARIALDFHQVNGRWVTQDQQMQEAGRVFFEGRWMLQQEVDVLKRRRADDLAAKKWFTNLKQLRNRMDNPAQVDEARDELHRIDDPTAGPALIQALDSERVRQVRIWYAETLAKLGTADAVRALANHALDDNDAEIRFTCIEQLAGPLAPGAVPQMIKALKGSDNGRINRAGLALGKMGDKSAIPALIDALVTTHKFSVKEGNDNPGGISAGFSPTGGGGLSMGSSTKIISVNMNNQQVLDALSALSGGVNFGFEKGRWRNWYASQSKPATGDSRRD